MTMTTTQAIITHAKDQVELLPTGIFIFIQHGKAIK